MSTPLPSKVINPNDNGGQHIVFAFNEIGLEISAYCYGSHMTTIDIPSTDLETFKKVVRDSLKHPHHPSPLNPAANGGERVIFCFDDKNETITIEALNYGVSSCVLNIHSVSYEKLNQFILDFL